MENVRKRKDTARKWKKRGRDRWGGCAGKRNEERKVKKKEEKKASLTRARREKEKKREKRRKERAKTRPVSSSLFALPLFQASREASLKGPGRARKLFPAEKTHVNDREDDTRQRRPGHEHVRRRRGRRRGHLRRRLLEAGKGGSGRGLFASSGAEGGFGVRGGGPAAGGEGEEGDHFF